MSRTSQNALVSAIKAMQGMDMQQKALLADEIFREKPNLLGSVLVLPQLGVSMQKVEFALEILFVCFKAMKASGLAWPIISEDELDLQSRRFSAIIQFADDLNQRLRDVSMQQYLASHLVRMSFLTKRSMSHRDNIRCRSKGGVQMSKAKQKQTPMLKRELKAQSPENLDPCGISARQTPGLRPAMQCIKGARKPFVHLKVDPCG